LRRAKNLQIKIFSRRFVGEKAKNILRGKLGGVRILGKKLFFE
jgi:hypothetical protein